MKVVQWLIKLKISHATSTKLVPCGAFPSFTKKRVAYLIAMATGFESYHVNTKYVYIIPYIYGLVAQRKKNEFCPSFTQKLPQDDANITFGVVAFNMYRAFSIPSEYSLTITPDVWGAFHFATRTYLPHSLKITPTDRNLSLA